MTKTNSKLNSLRAAVLGANDGIVSVAGTMLAMSGDKSTVLRVGIAAILSGALSMAAGEYASVSSQRDTEKALIEYEKNRLVKSESRLNSSLIKSYTREGLSLAEAIKLVDSLSKHKKLNRELANKYNIKTNDIASPIVAAISSMICFVLGAAIPFAFMLLLPSKWLVIPGVAIALALSGYISSLQTKASKVKSILRISLSGAFSLAITYIAGALIQ